MNVILLKQSVTIDKRHLNESKPSGLLIFIPGTDKHQSNPINGCINWIMGRLPADKKILQRDRVNLFLAINNLLNPTEPINISSSAIKSLHDRLLFHIAFPASEKIRETSMEGLKGIAEITKEIFAKNNSRKQFSLMNTGLPHTELLCNFSLPMANWLVNKFPKNVLLDSAESSIEKVRNIFQVIFPDIEYENCTQGELNLEARIKKLSGLKDPVLQLQWLLHHFEHRELPETVKNEFYQQLKIFIRWELHHPIFNRSFAWLPTKRIYYQKDLIKNPVCKQIIRQKMGPPISLARKEKNHLQDIIKASLAFQCRETDPVTYSDENELELFDMGHGILIALVGMKKERRLSLESYTGYMIFKNSIPVSYGGGWTWGERCKIGVNILPPFRRGESAFLFCQVLRLFHQRFGIKHFLVKPYQFGKGNPEGIRSGAFWFYYKLGFRPTNEKLNNIATKEWKKISTGSGYKSPVTILKTLASCNIELKLAGKINPSYDAGMISLSVSKMINRDFNGDRQKAISSLSGKLKAIIPAIILDKNPGIKQHVENWILLSGLIPGLENWKAAWKKDLARLIMLKSSGREIDYIKNLQKHKPLWLALHESLKRI